MASGGAARRKGWQGRVERKAIGASPGRAPILPDLNRAPLTREVLDELALSPSVLRSPLRVRDEDGAWLGEALPLGKVAQLRSLLC
eukprot:14003093-Alexandrium_andersonii.AAC.1